MQPCAELSEFLAAPVGKCFAGSTWLYFYPSDGFCGAILWDKQSRDDFERLVVLFKNELTRVQHVSMIDARRVTDADPRAFRVLSEYVSSHQDQLSRAVRKLAIVRPDGIVGAITAGFFGVVQSPYPVELFDDRTRALAWLGMSGAEEDLAREEARAAGSPPILRDLRALLEANLEDASLESAAKKLGTSARSLQRKLGEQDTTFQAEMNGARVRVAKRLLRDTDMKLSQVALEVGCASLASFSGLFRRATGETPSSFRERKRGAT